jgi:ATP phosphoribosyltransferase
MSSSSIPIDLTKISKRRSNPITVFTEYTDLLFEFLRAGRCGVHLMRLRGSTGFGSEPKMRT